MRPPPRDAGRFDGGSIDSGPILPPPDAGAREGDYWTLERRSAQLRTARELGCTQYEGGRIALVLTTTIETICEHAGPVETVVRDDGALSVTQYLWVQHRVDPDACLGVTAIAERTLVLQANEGTFRAVSDDGGSMAELRIGAIDDLPRTFETQGLGRPRELIAAPSRMTLGRRGSPMSTVFTPHRSPLDQGILAANLALAGLALGVVALAVTGQGSGGWLHAPIALALVTWFFATPVLAGLGGYRARAAGRPRVMLLHTILGAAWALGMTAALVSPILHA